MVEQQINKRGKSVFFHTVNCCFHHISPLSSMAKVETGASKGSYELDKRTVVLQQNPCFDYQTMEGICFVSPLQYIEAAVWCSSSYH